ncbi:MAG: hypothetical protein JXQ76_06410 [Campylobacterales bacterium]|nr:hypothetical protein [Campylobacterales bacterium]
MFSKKEKNDPKLEAYIKAETKLWNKEIKVDEAIDILVNEAGYTLQDANDVMMLIEDDIFKSEHPEIM